MAGMAEKRRKRGGPVDDESQAHSDLDETAGESAEGRFLDVGDVLQQGAINISIGHSAYKTIYLFLYSVSVHPTEPVLPQIGMTEPQRQERPVRRFLSLPCFRHVPVQTIGASRRPHRLIRDHPLRNTMDDHILRPVSSPKHGTFHYGADQVNLPVTCRI
jgi:hypothetical protein